MCAEDPRYNDGRHCQLYPCTQLMNTVQLLPLYHCILCEGESSTADLLYSTVKDRHKTKYTSFKTTQICHKYLSQHLLFSSTEKNVLSGVKSVHLHFSCQKIQLKIITRTVQNILLPSSSWKAGLSEMLVRITR